MKIPVNKSKKTLSAIGFVSDVAILSIAFILTIKFRRELADLFRKIPLPRFILYLVSSIPFIIFEETINCPQSECSFPVLSTLPILLIFVLTLGLVVKWRRAKNIWNIVTVFSILGILFELFIGESSGGLFSTHPLTLIFFIFWIGLSYAFLVIVPLTILIDNPKQKSL